MNTSTRPFGLPNKLTDPPVAPEGHRWSLRGNGWDSGRATNYICHTPEGWWGAAVMNKRTDAAPSYLYLEAIPLRPVPAGVEDAPDGFEFWNLGPLNVQPGRNSMDVAALMAHGGWVKGSSGETPDCCHALRIGSELHHLNFDAVEEKPELEKANELLDQAVGHLRAMLLTAESNSDRLDAWAWLDENFPEPEPEPDENGWLPIRFAQKSVGNNPRFMRLKWESKGETYEGDGMRYDDDYFAAAVFHKPGAASRELQYEFRQVKVNNPTHFKVERPANEEVQNASEIPEHLQHHVKP